MKKIIIALMLCFMFTSAGYCAPKHHPDRHGHHVVKKPVPQKIVTVRRHKHHVPLYTYDYYPGTQVIVNTGGFSVSYGVGCGGGYVTYGGGFRL